MISFMRFLKTSKSFLGKEHKEHIKKFEHEIDFSFKDKKHIFKALVHPSYANEHADTIFFNNQRYEFLGDAVLDLVISDKLIEDYPTMNEGDLSKLRANMVSEEGLMRIARMINLKDFVLLGKGEENSGGRGKPSIISDCFEAVIAAAYLDRGLHPTKKLIYRLFKVYFDEIAEVNIHQDVEFDYKSKLQELIQRLLRATPMYKIVTEEGPDHNKIFTAEVLINGVRITTGKGKSKKEAEQQAAQDALTLIS